MARCYIGRGLEISIHALREEGDRIYFDVDQYGVIRISIHALREEGDMASCVALLCCRIFLSTPSARRATAFDRGSSRDRLFLSTPSARRATYMDSVPHIHLDISIHALREEGDACS